MNPTLRNNYTRRRLIGLSLVGALIACIMCLTGTTAAHAQGVRWQLPIVAGTRLDVPGSKQCTVGAVLTSTSVFSRLTAYQRAVRYLVIAKHCARVDTDVSIAGGPPIGTVMWAAPNDDLELVRVLPNVQRSVLCDGASQLHRCTVSERVFPRAFGRIFLSPRFGEQAVPMVGSAIPGGDETFCTSGSSSGVNCSWRTAPTPPPSDGFEPGEAAAAYGSGYGVVVGDSGGPVAGTNGQFYGIITQRGFGPLLGLMAYIPSDRVFAAIGNSYVIASPN